MTDTSNYVYLAMGPNAWGSSPTKFGALRNMVANVGYGSVRKRGFRIYSVHPDFEINEVDGTVYTPIGHKAIMVLDRKR